MPMRLKGFFGGVFLEMFFLVSFFFFFFFLDSSVGGEIISAEFEDKKKNWLTLLSGFILSIKR